MEKYLYAISYIVILYGYTYIDILYVFAYRRAMHRSVRTPKQLGAILRRERRRQGLTQTELGDRIGLRQATISKLEAGEPATRIRTLLDALTALNLEISINERVRGSGDDIETLF